MFLLLTKILECIACKYSCQEKGLCSFNKHELSSVIELASRIFSRDIDATLDLRYKLFEKIDRKIAIRATLATIGLLKIAEFVESNDIEDILVIPGRPIYITKHAEKLRTSKIADITLVKNMLKLAHMKGIELTTANPSIRYGVRFGPIRMRISLDLPPVVPNPQAYLRIHKSKITIDKLLDSRFITMEQLHEIYRLIKEGKHIVITGPPGSGKTTFLVALDDLIPPNLQRVYIDEADEFDEDPKKNQIKIRNVDKIKEVYASLNRNIDVIFIGELQYENHFHAFKTATEIGIQTLATMHSTSVNDAIERLEKYVKLKNIAIIQLAKQPKEAVKRKVVEVYVK